MKKAYSILFVALLVGLLNGCGEKKSPATSGGPIAVFKVPEETELVKVGDRVITAGDFRRRFAYETGVFSFTMKNAKQAPKDPEKRLAIFESQRLPRIVPQLVHCALLDQYLDTSCGGRDVKDADKEVENAVLHFLPKKQRALGLDGLVKAIGTTPEYFKEQILVSAREEKARLVFDPASKTVSEKEVDEGLARMDAYTARAVASNQVIWVSASNVLARVKSGADFAELGNNVGDAGHESEEWGSFEQSELESVPLRTWAFSAKVGEVGGPFEVEDGLSIVKLLDRQGGTAESSLASAQTAEVTLARINLPMIDENPEPKTREHCHKALLGWKARDAKKRLFEKLLKETKIEYPNGDKLDFKK